MIKIKTIFYLYAIDDRIPVGDFSTIEEMKESIRTLEFDDSDMVHLPIQMYEMSMDEDGFCETVGLIGKPLTTIEECLTL